MQVKLNFAKADGQLVLKESLKPASDFTNIRFGIGTMGAHGKFGFEIPETANLDGTTPVIEICERTQGEKSWVVCGAAGERLRPYPPPTDIPEGFVVQARFFASDVIQIEAQRDLTLSIVQFVATVGEDGKFFIYWERLWSGKASNLQITEKAMEESVKVACLKAVSEDRTQPQYVAA